MGHLHTSTPSSGEGREQRHTNINQQFDRILHLWIDWQLFSFLPLCQGIIRRDEIVFRAARRRGIPILMVTSGGYQKKTARIIADSILNLQQQGLIGAEAMEGEGSSPLVSSMMATSGSAGSRFTAIWRFNTHRCCDRCCGHWSNFISCS